MGYCWEGSSCIAIPLTSIFDIVGQHKIGIITLRAALTFTEGLTSAQKSTGCLSLLGTNMISSYCLYFTVILSLKTLGRDLRFFHYCNGMQQCVIQVCNCSASFLYTTAVLIII